MALSPGATDVLRTLEWSDAYHYPVDGFDEHMQRLGHAFLPAARPFLALYGGLSFAFKSPYQQGIIAWHTDPIGAARRLFPGHLSDHEQELGAKLCPIGEAGYGWWILMMDEHGRVFGSDGLVNLSKWADSGEELIEKLCCGGGAEPLDPSDFEPPAA
jgi:hypothetical protein